MQFYILFPQGLRFGYTWAYFLQNEKVKGTKYVKCPKCKHSISCLEWLPPHEIEISRSIPKWWGDFLWGPALLFMTSQRFIEIYNREKLTGIDKFHPPAEIVRLGTKKPKDISVPLPQYSVIEMLWKGVRQDDRLSEFSYESVSTPPVCEYCHNGMWHRKQKRTVIDESTWDGSDFFVVVNNTGLVFADEKAISVIEKYGLTNVKYLRTEDCAFDDAQLVETRK